MDADPEARLAEEQAPAAAAGADPAAAGPTADPTAGPTAGEAAAGTDPAAAGATADPTAGPTAGEAAAGTDPAAGGEAGVPAGAEPAEANAIPLAAARGEAASVTAGGAGGAGGVDADPEARLAEEQAAAPPLLLVVEGVTDPGNLGAILRTAECAGVTGVVLPRHRAARITPTVAKRAAGAIEHLRFAPVSGIPAALAKLSELGVWSVGLDVTADQTIWDLPIADAPLALVLGAEGRGLGRLVRRRCDVTARIPVSGRLDALNVAAAGAVALFEVLRRRASGERAE